MSALRRVRELPDFDRLCEMQTREGERGPNLLNSLDVIFGWFKRLFSSRVVWRGKRCNAVETGYKVPSRDKA